MRNARRIAGRIAAPGGFEQVFRGEGPASVKGGAYWSPSEEWAAQFTRGGRASELRRAWVRTSDIWDAGEGARPYAGDPDAVGAAAREAGAAGFKAVRLDEGAGEPPSVFMFDRSALGRAVARVMSQ